MNEKDFLKEHQSFNKFNDRKGFDVAINKDMPLQPQIDEFMERFKAELRRQIHETQLDKAKVKKAINKRLYKLRNISNRSLSDLMKELSKDMEEFIEELGLKEV